MLDRLLVLTFALVFATANIMYTEAAKAQAKAMGEAREKMWSEASGMRERMELASKLSKQRAEGMENVSAAMEKLYSVLSEKQRARLERFGPGPWFRG